MYVSQLWYGILVAQFTGEWHLLQDVDADLVPQEAGNLEDVPKTPFYMENWQLYIHYAYNADVFFVSPKPPPLTSILQVEIQGQHLSQHSILFGH